MIGLKQRVLEKLSYRYWLKNKARNGEENWKLAEKLLKYIEKRKSLIKKMVDKGEK